MKSATTLFTIASFIAGLAVAQETPVPAAAPAAAPAPAATATVPAKPAADSPPLPPVEPLPPRVFENPPQITVDVLMVSVPPDKSLALLAQLREPTQIGTAVSTLLTMIGRKEATLLDWPMVTTPSGVRGVSEEIVEQIYPTEFELPQDPQTFGNAQRVLSESEKALRALVNFGLAVPTTFETRNTGTTLEVECAASPDYAAVSGQLSAQTVELLGFVHFSSVKTDKGESAGNPQPQFRTRKTSTAFTLRNGESRLIYSGKPLQADAGMTFFILHAKITPPLAFDAKRK